MRKGRGLASPGADSHGGDGPAAEKDHIEGDGVPLAAETQGVRVLGLSMHADGKLVMGMLQAGASGYALKDRADKELADAIRAVMAGRTYLSPEIADLAGPRC